MSSATNFIDLSKVPITMSNPIELSHISAARGSMPKGAVPREGSHTINKGNTQQVRMNFDRIDLGNKQAETDETAKSEAERQNYRRLAEKNPVFASLDSLSRTVQNISDGFSNLLDRYHLYDENISYYQGLLNDGSHPLTDEDRKAYSDRISNLQGKKRFLEQNGYIEGEPGTAVPDKTDLMIIQIELSTLAFAKKLKHVLKYGTEDLNAKIASAEIFQFPTSDFEHDVGKAADDWQKIGDDISKLWNSYHNGQGNEPDAPATLSQTEDSEKEADTDPVQQLDDLENGKTEKDPVYDSLDSMDRAVKNISDGYRNLQERHELYDKNIAHYQGLLNDGNHPLSDNERKAYSDKINELQDKKQFLEKNGYIKDEPDSAVPSEKDLKVIRKGMDQLASESEKQSAKKSAEIPDIDSIRPDLAFAESFHFPVSNFEQAVTNMMSVWNNIAGKVNSLWDSYHNKQGNEPDAPSALNQAENISEKQTDSDPVKRLLELESPQYREMKNLLQRVSRLHDDEFIPVLSPNE